jgi:hypothetical protein
MMSSLGIREHLILMGRYLVNYGIHTRQANFGRICDIIFQIIEYFGQNSTYKSEKGLVHHL